MYVSIRLTARTTLASLAVIALSGCAVISTGGDKGVPVNGVPADITVKDNGFSWCVTPYFCAKKSTPTAYTYNDTVWGVAKFRPGSITLPSGQTLSGDLVPLAMDESGQWEFVKQMALFRPAGEAEARFYGPYEMLTVTQIIGEKTRTYDQFGDAYLERIVSGTWRLSYNPGFKVKDLRDQKMGFGTRLLAQEIGAAAGNRAGGEVVRSGGDLGEAVTMSGEVGEIATLGVIALLRGVDKGYLLYNEITGRTEVIDAENYTPVTESVASSCPSGSLRTLALYDDIESIEQFVGALNELCA